MPEEFDERPDGKLVRHPSLGPPEIFTEVRKVAGAESRRNLLKTLCAGDAQLHQSLLSMLNALEREEGRQALRPGLILEDRYCLESEIGRGATSVVWQGQDLKMHRSVALKVFRRQISAGLYSRLVEEARAAADVESDHVVRVHDVSSPTSTAPFIVLQLCREFRDGASCLSQSLAHHGQGEVGAPRSAEEAARWIEQAARGVHAAHERGVYHQDVKPANILLRVVTRTVQVTDFGAAVQEMGEEVGEDGTVWMELPKGRLVGTPAYMSPERAQGEFLDALTPPGCAALARGDVYGLGATLYELLSGHPPYRARPGAEFPPLDIIEQVKLNAPSPLRRVGEHFWVPVRLRRIVAKAMSHDPKERYATPLQLAEDLERWRTFKLTSIETGRPRLLLRNVLWSRRHPLFAMNLVSLVATLALVLTSARWEHRATEFRLRADEGEEMARAAEVRVEEARRDETLVSSNAIFASWQAAHEVEKARRSADSSEAGRKVAEQARKLAETGTQLAKLGAARAWQRGQRSDAEATKMKRERDAAIDAGVAAFHIAEELAGLAAAAERRAATATNRAEQAEGRAAEAGEREQAAVERADRAEDAGRLAEIRASEAEARTQQLDDARRARERCLSDAGNLPEAKACFGAEMSPSPEQLPGSPPMDPGSPLFAGDAPKRAGE